uniref:Cyclin-dependent kinase 2-interacting protein n=1 Tax=Stomoxys calcitrans TaxID=35570 RepID=A0A1I8Q141_STOCA
MASKNKNLQNFPESPSEEQNPTLSPVWYSPRTKSIAPSDSNILVCISRLEAIIKTTVEHFQKWNLAEKRGVQICLHIESIKSKAFELINSSEKSKDFTLYPSAMKPQCKNLAILSSICHDISVKTKDSLRQLKSLSKSPGSSNVIFYRSWQLPEYIAFLEDLSNRYEKEAEVKKAVAENIPHCTSKSELIRWTSLWECPQYVDAYVSALFLYFKEETANKNNS